MHQWKLLRMAAECLPVESRHVLQFHSVEWNVSRDGARHLYHQWIVRLQRIEWRRNSDRYWRRHDLSDGRSAGQYRQWRKRHAERPEFRPLPGRSVLSESYPDGR